ncbi:MAG: hypothetical protein HC869_18205 [Rhodospirillales bacterium]|nr:hypothetical protein [Rhodospirillales bacterium]
MANPAGNGAGALGGAIYAIAGTLEIRNSSLVLNNAYGGASNAAGFVGGRAEGGAVYASGLTALVIEDATFNSNFAVGGAGVTSGGVAKGGAMSVAGTTATVANSDFTANAITGGLASGGTSGESIGGAVARAFHAQGATVAISGTILFIIVGATTFSQIPYEVPIITLW